VKPFKYSRKSAAANEREQVPMSFLPSSENGNPRPRRPAAICGRFARMPSFTVIVSAAVVFLLFAVLVPNFLRPVNLASMARTITVLLITGFAMMAAIGMGAFDLSVGSTAGLAAIACASCFAHGLDVVASVAIALLVGMVCGAVNGALVAGFGITPFVVTLGTFSVFEGVSLLYTDGSSILIGNAAFEAFGSASLGWFPVIAMIPALLGVIWALVMRGSPFGKRVLAIGGNMRAAQAVGLPVRMTRFAVFVVIGLSAALAGIVEAATLLNVSPALGQDNYNLLTIAVVVIGGTSLRGGDITVLGTVFGAMLIVFVQAGLQVMGLSSLLDGLVVGTVLIAALFLAAIRDRMHYRLIFGGRRTQRLT